MSVGEAGTIAYETTVCDEIARKVDRRKCVTLRQHDELTAAANYK
jgi:hypothetical protein